MRIRLVIALFVTAIAAVGCGSLHQNRAVGGSDSESASFAAGSDIDTASTSQTGLPDYRQVLADPGPF